jgi:N-acetylglucosamine-6-sulfatase
VYFRNTFATTSLCSPSRASILTGMYAHKHGVTNNFTEFSPSSAFTLDDKPDWYKQRLPTWHGIYGPLFEYRRNFPDTSPEGVAAFEEMVRSYWRVILSVDDSVGRIYSLLRQRDELDHTIFIFTTDNGLLNGEHGFVDKRTANEESIRLPLVVRYPGLTPSSQPRVVDQMILTTDFAPTILDLVGLPIPAQMQGRSWKKLAQGQADPQWRTSFAYLYNYEKQFPYTPNVRALRTQEWKYIRYPNSSVPYLAELYHLTDDPLENVNLINDPRYRRTVDELHAALDRQLQALGAWPDRMPIAEGIGHDLPAANIR